MTKRISVLIVSIVCLGTFRLSAQAPASAARPTIRPSDEINKIMPRWLKFGGEYRARLEGFSSGGFNTSQDAYVLSRVRLNMSVLPTSWLKLQLQAQDAQVF